MARAVPHCDLRIGQRVRMISEAYRSDWPAVVVITGIDWNPARGPEINISIMTDDEIGAGHAPTDGWGPQDFAAIQPDDQSGIEIDMLGGNCPVQGEGRADGVEFYFRARGQRWSISMGSTVPVDDPAWYWEEPYGDGPYAAGWMSEDEARAFIVSAIARWRRGEPSKMRW